MPTPKSITIKRLRELEAEVIAEMRSAGAGSTVNLYKEGMDMLIEKASKEAK
jgi:hypothetical protein